VVWLFDLRQGLYFTLAPDLRSSIPIEMLRLIARRALSSSSASGPVLPVLAEGLTITPEPHPRTPPPNKSLVFGQTFSDHMLTIDWTREGGWQSPAIVPYGPMAIDPAASVLHYALECFEGCKAYRTAEGQVRLFRPDMNLARLTTSTSGRAPRPRAHGGRLATLSSASRLAQGETAGWLRERRRDQGRTGVGSPRFHQPAGWLRERRLRERPRPRTPDAPISNNFDGQPTSSSCCPSSRLLRAAAVRASALFGD
jgi:hypothetical protein